MEPREPLKEQQDDNIDLDDSRGMNEDQQALFLQIQRSKSADSVLGKLLPHPNEVPDRCLVWDVSPHLTSNIIINRSRSKSKRDPTPEPQPQNGASLHIFKKVKKEKVRSRCDYDKNICGYITKKVIRQFVSKNYEIDVNQLVRKYRSNYAECKAFYLKKVQMVTGPSHLPDLFNPSQNQPESINNCKKVFKHFYRWFLKERYLRYLLLEGKMSDKLAYIEYKNSHLFKFVCQDSQEEIEVLQNRIQTRSRSAVKLQQDQNWE